MLRSSIRFFRSTFSSSFWSVLNLFLFPTTLTCFILWIVLLLFYWFPKITFSLDCTSFCPVQDYFQDFRRYLFGRCSYGFGMFLRCNSLISLDWSSSCFFLFRSFCSNDTKIPLACQSFLFNFIKYSLFQHLSQ